MLEKATWITTSQARLSTPLPSQEVGLIARLLESLRSAIDQAPWFSSGGPPELGPGDEDDCNLNSGWYIIGLLN